MFRPTDIMGITGIEPGAKGFLAGLQQLLDRLGIDRSSRMRSFNPDITALADRLGEPEENRQLKRIRHPAVGRVREYIHDHYDSPVSLETLAEVADLSIFHTLRLFREEEGRTPHRYLLDVRIEEAKEFLRRGYPIVDVALMTGFYDQSHFTNTFRKHTGMTPKAFAEKESDSKNFQEEE